MKHKSLCSYSYTKYQTFLVFLCTISIISCIYLWSKVFPRCLCSINLIMPLIVILCGWLLLTQTIYSVSHILTVAYPTVQNKCLAIGVRTACCTRGRVICVINCACSTTVTTFWKYYKEQLVYLKQRIIEIIKKWESWTM